MKFIFGPNFCDLRKKYTIIYKVIRHPPRPSASIFKVEYGDIPNTASYIRIRLCHVVQNRNLYFLRDSSVLGSSNPHQYITVRKGVTHGEEKSQDNEATKD
jgi:hypothetical protein